jgi:hypothetical protein
VPSPFSVRRRSFEPIARRTHASVPPDFLVREPSAARSPRPLHSCFLKDFLTSPSTDSLAGRRLTIPPANLFLRDSAASG